MFAYVREEKNGRMGDRYAYSDLFEGHDIGFILDCGDPTFDLSSIAAI